MVVVVGLAAILFLTLGGDDDPTPAADSTTAPSSSSSSSPSRSTSSPPPSPPQPGGGRDLLAILPPDLTGCAEAPLAGDGDIAHVACTGSVSQPVPQAGEFFLYPDQVTMDDVFATDTAGAPQLPQGQDCTTGTGTSVWTSASSSGSYACAIDAENGRVGIVWTDDAALVEGVVAAPGTTQEDLAALYRWWVANSSYRL
ncbi:hypothetical protein ACI78V_14035 [Geodermatophilus sp. SYSU D00742]